MVGGMSDPHDLSPMPSAAPAEPMPSDAAPAPDSWEGRQLQARAGPYWREQAAHDARGGRPAGPAERDAQRQAVSTAPGAGDDPELEVGGFKVRESELRDYMARKAEIASGRAQVPASPDGYRPDLPGDFKPADGFEVTIDETDPSFVAARALAFKSGMSQRAFSELLAIHATSQLREQTEIAAARDAELAKLGTTAPLRIDAMNRWLDARGASALKGSVWTAEQVEAIEHLIQAFQTQGASSAPANHGEQPPGDGRIPGYDKMTFEQRMAAIDSLRRGRPQ